MTTAKIALSLLMLGGHNFGKHLAIKTFMKGDPTDIGPMMEITKRQCRLVHESWCMIKPVEANSKRMMNWMWPDLKRKILQKT